MATTNLDSLITKDVVLKKAGSYTLTLEDSSKLMIFDAADKVFTLPTAVGNTGLRYKCAVSANATGGATGSRLAPATGEKIVGNGVTGAINKTFTSTQATTKEGDFIEVVSDGAIWYVTDIVGTWAYA